MSYLVVFGLSVDGLDDGGIAVISLAPAGDRVPASDVEASHQQRVREALVAAPETVVAATLHDSDDDLSAYALRVSDGSVVVNDGEYSGKDRDFEIVFWQVDPEQPPATDDQLGDASLVLDEIMALGEEAGIGEGSRLVVGVDGGGRAQDAEVRYRKPDTDEDEDDL